jgi:xanthine dehydrogenase YagS FAD-binding subunit
MRQFTYTRPQTIQEAIQAHNSEAAFVGGGTNLIDLMKMGVERPARLIDINRLPLRDIQDHEGGIRIGALVSNTDAANHSLIRNRYPVLSEAILAGASQQLRNMATMGGNLLQRTRCYYFYDPTYKACNKRSPGTGCAARRGFNRIHAILGTSEACIAVHPSDMCVALSALNATVQVSGPHGERAISFGEFHRLPGNTPHVDTNLRPDELVTYIDIPPLSYARRSTYLKVRDRNSYAFALVSVAAILDLDAGGVVRESRIALGGVAHKPWRATKAEKILTGHRLEEKILREAAEAELAPAQAYRDNRFKVELARRSIVRAVMTAGEKNA